MSNLEIGLVLFTGGVIADLVIYKHKNEIAIRLMKIFNFGWANNKSFISSSSFGNYILGNKGENAGTEQKTVEIPADLQPVVDKVVQARIAREREKFADYDDLKKFKTEYEKSQEQKTQEELLKQKKYEEAENLYKGKINEFSQKLTAKEQEIQNLRIDHALTNEISRANGFVEESVALLKGQVVVDSNGNLSIKSKDANGLDVNLPLSEGVKKFYEQRPHLLKATHKPGAGTGAGDTVSGTGSQTGTALDGDLNYLNAQLIKARGAGDGKQVQAITQKIKTAMKAKGVSV